jgi:arylsulfatase A-like enzyme
MSLNRILLLALVCLTAHCGLAARQPNLVFIIADDLGYGDLGCYGATRIKTPNVDRLASQGLRFTHAYAPSSTCTPSRYALLTGEYGWRQPPKKTNILDGDAPLCIDPARFTLAQLFHQAGYTSALIGKWHLGLGDGITPINFNTEIKPGPLEIGFDSAFFIPATVDRVPCVFIENHRVHNLDPSDPIQVSYQKRIGDIPLGTERPDLLKQKADKQHSNTILNGISRIGYMTGGKSACWVDENIADTLTQRAVKFIEQNQEKRFFLYFGLHDPHVPRVPHPRFHDATPYGPRGNAIAQLDWEVGEIINTLDRLKLANDTLIILTSDNGPVLFDGYFDDAVELAGGHRPAGELRGAKYLVYEGGTRVPFIARWPQQITPGVSDLMISLQDMLATCAALTGQKLPSGAGPDSMNLLPVLLGKAQTPLRTSIVQHGISGQLALRDGPWKYIPASAAKQVSGMGSGADPKDTRFKEAYIAEPLLYNLTDDPAETKNLAHEMPEKAAALKAKLEEIIRGK